MQFRKPSNLQKFSCITVMSTVTPANSTLRIEMLGGLQVFVAGIPVAQKMWGRESARKLVAYLALNSGTKLSKRRLGALLDAEADDRKIANAIYSARRALGIAAYVLQSDSEQVWLGESANVWIDVDAFEQAIDVLAVLKDDKERLELYEKSTLLHRGPLLPEYDDAPIASDRVALNARHSGLLREYSTLLSRYGQTENALKVDNKRFRLDPLDELSAHDLMKRLGDEGRSTDALEVYSRHRSMLASTYGKAPASELQEYADSLRNLRTDVNVEHDNSETSRDLARSEQGSSQILPHQRFSPVHFDKTVVGRAHDVEQVVTMLSRSDVRLLTLYGVGGVGKTTLAEAALNVLRSNNTADDFDFKIIDMRLISRTEPLLTAIAAVLGISLPKAVSLIVLEPLNDCDVSLLVLDNFEFVRSESGSISTLLALQPNLMLLVTSRLPLGIAEEWAYRVTPLSIPAHEAHFPNSSTGIEGELAVESVLALPAAKIFCERAFRVNSTFELTAANLGPVISVLRAVEGIPLAIELVAAKCRYMSLDSIAESLERGIELLGDIGETPERDGGNHRSMSASLYWAYDSLSSEARKLLRYSAVYVDGFTPSMLFATMRERVGNVYVLLDELFDAALLVALPETAPARNAELRFRLLEPVRRLAFSLLSKSESEFSDARKLHALHFEAYLADTAWRVLGRPSEAISMYSSEEANLEEALSYLQTNAPSVFIGAIINLVKVNIVVFSKSRFVRFFYDGHNQMTAFVLDDEQKMFIKAGVILGHMSVAPGTLSPEVNQDALMSASKSIFENYLHLEPSVQVDHHSLYCLWRAVDLRNLADRCSVEFGAEITALLEKLPESAHAQEYAQRIWATLQLITFDTTLQLTHFSKVLPNSKVSLWPQVFRLFFEVDNALATGAPSTGVLNRLFEKIKTIDLPSRRIGPLANAMDSSLEACKLELFYVLLEFQISTLRIASTKKSDLNRNAIHLRLLAACRPEIFSESIVDSFIPLTKTEWDYGFVAYREVVLSWFRFRAVDSDPALVASRLNVFRDSSLPGFGVFDTPRVADALAIIALSVDAKALASTLVQIGEEGRHLFGMCLTPLDTVLHKKHNLNKLVQRKRINNSEQHPSFSKRDFYGSGFHKICAPLIDQLIERLNR
jgi:predicted ATPase/DNA-binding SARP family transcriptional activator